MQLGDFELHLLMSGRWKADGGLMFGVVPKILWEKQKPADQNNMIECACVCLVARIKGCVGVQHDGGGRHEFHMRSAGAATEHVCRHGEGAGRLVFPASADKN